MKAEERKHLKENEFQEWLGRTWRSVMSGSTVNTVIWSVILVGLVVLLGWRYYSSTAVAARSALWTALESATTPDALNAIIKEGKGSQVSRVARFHLARYQLQDAQNRLAGPNPADRATAADDMVSARDNYRDLVKENPSEPTLAEEAMMNIAKAEETLAGVPKSDSETEMRGTLDQAVVLYKELAAKFPKSYLGQQAALRAKEIDDHKTQITAFYTALAKEHGKPPEIKLPELPKPPDAPKPESPKPDDGKSKN